MSDDLSNQLNNMTLMSVNLNTKLRGGPSPFLLDIRRGYSPTLTKLSEKYDATPEIFTKNNCEELKSLGDPIYISSRIMSPIKGKHFSETTKQKISEEIDNILQFHIKSIPEQSAEIKGEAYKLGMIKYTLCKCVNNGGNCSQPEFTMGGRRRKNRKTKRRKSMKKRRRNTRRR